MAPRCCRESDVGIRLQEAEHGGCFTAKHGKLCTDGLYEAAELRACSAHGPDASIAGDGSSPGTTGALRPEWGGRHRLLYWDSEGFIREHGARCGGVPGAFRKQPERAVD